MMINDFEFVDIVAS